MYVKIHQKNLMISRDVFMASSSSGGSSSTNIQRAFDSYAENLFADYQIKKGANDKAMVNELEKISKSDFSDLLGIKKSVIEEVIGKENASMG